MGDDDLDLLHSVIIADDPGSVGQAGTSGHRCASDQDGCMARLRQLVVDCREPSGRLARFGAAALDEFEIRAYGADEVARLASIGRTPETDPCVILDGPMLKICSQEIDDVSRRTKRPMHIDIDT